MKSFSFVLILVFLLGCKEEKTFADDIVLSFPKDEKMTFQQFNEGIGERGTGIIYIGKDTSTIDVKYFDSMIPAPPPPPGYKLDSINIRNQKMFSKYFHDSFDRMKYSEKPIIFDSLSENNIKIIAKIKDTIPKYTFNYDNEKLKKYKSFPVFIKNISGRKLLLSDLKNLPIAFLNDKNKWQMLWNENSMGGCLVDGWENHYYWEFQPDEIMVLSVNYLTGNSRGKFKIWSGNTSSNEFTMNYNKEILKNQRHYFEVK